MREKPTNTQIIHSVYQLSISQKAIGTLPEDGYVIPKHVRVEATIYNY
jgi:hypothetical protein